MQESLTCHNASASNERQRGPLYSVFPAKAAEVSSVQDLYEFICSGPLLNRVGLTPDLIAESIDKWLAYGSHLCRLFQLNELYLNFNQKVRFYHYYIPVFMWCEDQISQHRSGYKEGEDIPPLVVRLLCSSHYLNYTVTLCSVSIWVLFYYYIFWKWWQNKWKGLQLWRVSDIITKAKNLSNRRLVSVLRKAVERLHSSLLWIIFFALLAGRLQSICLLWKSWKI